MLFVGRKEFRDNFWRQYNKIQAGSPIVLNYYGAGGIGKSSLINQLVREIDERKKLYASIFGDVYVLRHDFVNGTDVRVLLNRWKNELAEFGCEFPFFETGDFFLSLKLGARNIDKPTMRSQIENNEFMKKIKDGLEKGAIVIDAGLDDLNDFSFEDTPELLEALSVLPGIKTVNALVGLINRTLARNRTEKHLQTNVEVNAELNRRAAMRNPLELDNFLPVLFAQDIRDWSGNRKFIIFLDTFEQLVDEGSGGTRMSAKNSYADDWLFNPTDGLVSLIPNGLWLIAGRDKINRPAVEHFLIEGFSDEDANTFLIDAGVEDPAYRDEIIRLTDGYPLFLEECAKFLRKADDKPPIEVLDKNCRKNVINRLTKNIFEDGTMLSMIQGLCVLGKWTNKSARKLLPNFNANTYKRVKNLPFIRRRRDENGNEAFRFDEPVRQLMLPTIEDDDDLRELIEEINIAVVPPIDASESIEMRRGQKIALSALKNISVALDWTAGFDIKAVVFMLRADGSIVEERNEKVFAVELDKISDDISKIRFALAIEGGQTFAEVSAIELRLVDENRRKEILHFGFGSDLTVETAVVVGEIYRHKGNWKFNAIGAGFKGGLSAVRQ